MTIFLAILTPIVGILGVVLGVLLNEVMRRKNRREVYAPKIFEKRLSAYEGLAEHIQSGSEIADEMIENLSLTKEDSGIAQINKLFKSINRPALNGPIIERIRELRHLQLKK